MWAWVSDGSFRPDGIRLEERERPAVGSGDALVRTEAVALNYRDLLVIKGVGRWRPPVGRIPCSDACGIVEEVGPNVKGLKVGDRVISTILPNWLSGPLEASKLVGSLGGSSADGVLGELVSLRANSLVPVGSRLTSSEWATLPCAALTAWQSLCRANSLRADQSVLIQGTGGVSLFALQFAIAAGARVVITSSSDAKLKRALALGAAAGVNYRTSEDWVAEAKALSPEGYDQVIDVGGASTLSNSIDLAAYEGTISVVGLIGGLEACLDITPVFSKNLRIDGIEVGSRAMLNDMIAWCDGHRIKPVIDRVFYRDTAGEAFAHLASAAHFGKIVIDVRGSSEL
jgi:NADPH:quinone reductase-like Zn-dependent oxidoreductase